MSMRKPITLTWEKKKYTIIITMDVIDKLEDHVNLALLVQRCQQGDVRMSHAAKLIWLLLLSAGATTEVEDEEGGITSADISYEDVYSSMHGAGDLTPGQVGVLLREIFTVIFPAPRKKSYSTAAKNKASTKAKATRGKRSTK